MKPIQPTEDSIRHFTWPETIAEGARLTDMSRYTQGEFIIDHVDDGSEPDTFWTWSPKDPAEDVDVREPYFAGDPIPDKFHIVEWLK